MCLAVSTPVVVSADYGMYHKSVDINISNKSVCFNHLQTL